MAQRGGGAAYVRTKKSRFGLDTKSGYENNHTLKAIDIRAEQTITISAPFPMEGGCGCRTVRYRIETHPIIVHCCHCRWCQRESGASFALNMAIETERMTLLAGDPAMVKTPSSSGLGQRIARCPVCQIALWSNYGNGGDRLRYVRVGSLDAPDGIQPDIHIFTASKQPWVVIPSGMPAFEEYYDAKDLWPKESLERYARLKANAD